MLSVLLGVAVGSGREPTTAQDETRPTPRRSSDRQVDEEPDGSRLIDTANTFNEEHQLEPVPAALLLDTQVAKFRMILGRLSLDPPAHIKCERSAKLSCGGDERVEVTAARGIPSLHYYLETSNRRLTVDVSDAEYVQIRSEVESEFSLEKLKIDQPPQGAIKLSLSSHDQLSKEVIEQEFKVASFVHLKASYPQVYQRHVAPMLSRLLERPAIACRATDLIRALEAASPSDDTLHANVDRLIDELRSPSRETRNEAEKDLRGLGLPALCLIDSKLQRGSDLDIEQQMRLKRVRNAIAPKAGDSPRQLARWLASDINYWNTVANDLSVAQLQAVQQDLVSVTGQTLRPELRVADASLQR